MMWPEEPTPRLPGDPVKVWIQAASQCALGIPGRYWAIVGRLPGGTYALRALDDLTIKSTCPAAGRGPMRRGFVTFEFFGENT